MKDIPLRGWDEEGLTPASPPQPGFGGNRTDGTVEGSGGECPQCGGTLTDFITNPQAEAVHRQGCDSCDWMAP